ncbi:MAG: dual specificity protein phosphatase family protein [Bryobacteraceae bacterium]|nr:dual specificity protein phosphatase family protein [Bryobacteraceae bacterium]
MMWTKLHWVDGPWPGKLALAARPRGGEWLEDEITSWQREGVNTVFSLLTDEEERDLGILKEKAEVEAHGMKFFSYPIPDRQVPDSEANLGKALAKLEAELAAGRNVVLHCRQGIGRTGLVAACLLLTKGIDPESAITRLSTARGTSIPETPEQRRWIDHYAESFAPR